MNDELGMMNVGLGKGSPLGHREGGGRYGKKSNRAMSKSKNPQNFKPGTVVRLHNTEDSFLGPWLEGEKATICEGEGLDWGKILVRLYDPELARAVTQTDGTEVPKGLIAVNLENLEIIE